MKKTNLYLLTFLIFTIMIFIMTYFITNELYEYVIIFSPLLVINPLLVYLSAKHIEKQGVV